jgi:hypothetical protein
MPSPILARADALMQRRHQSGSEPGDLPILTDAIEDDDDLPVLNDIATFAPVDAAAPLAEPAAQPESHSTPSPSAAFDSEFSRQLVNQLAGRLEQRILAELPRIIEATVRDFLAEREIAATQQQAD